MLIPLPVSSRTFEIRWQYIWVQNDAGSTWKLSDDPYVPADENTNS